MIIARVEIKSIFNEIDQFSVLFLKGILPMNMIQINTAIRSGPLSPLSDHVGDNAG